MSKHIQILPEHLASKIRAGEVVQRPESVLKELLENAIDAGATTVHVQVKQAGKSLIRVTDNGTGMSPEDARLACHHHATSKISSMDDLEHIRTLGFRGEGLASIVAVSQAELRTRRAEDDLAFVMRMEGGEIVETTQEAAPVGTTVIVKNLFYNTPARRHFMKSDATELKHCAEAVYRVALGFPHIGFTLLSGDDVIVATEPADLPVRLQQLYGEQFAAAHIPVEDSTDIISVWGFISTPAFARHTKADQYLFLNNRFIQSKSLQHAVFSAYEHVLIKGNYPSYFLFVSLDPRHVDVNVHPQKLEVKFDDERMVYNMIHAVVKRGISTQMILPEAAFSDALGNDDDARLRFVPPSAMPAGGPGGVRVNTATGEVMSGMSGGGWQRGPEIEPPDAIASLFATAPVMEQPTRDYHHDTLRKDVAEIGTSIWQVHNKYIMAQIRTGIMIVDQHVAHERVLYEKALHTLSNNLPFSQQLLFPCSVPLSPGDIALVRSLLVDLEPLGFALRFFGKDTVIIDAVPHDVRPGSESRILMELVHQAREFDRMGVADARDMVAKTFACKAAIKAGDRLTGPEMNGLIDQLFATQMPYVCPHGRPIVIKIALDELDRRFGRPIP